MAGYIKLYRDLKDNPIWQDRPFSKGQAWIDIILRCNHVCNKVTGYGKCEWVLRGQFISSNYKLAEYWGWSESTVRIFIKLLESEKMIIKKSFSKYTLYEVTNYCVYQSIDTEGLQEITNAQKTHKKRTRHAQKTPNNNDNNNKELYLKHVYIANDEYQNLIKDYNMQTITDYIQRLNDYIEQIGVDKANLKYKSHSATIRNWIRRDEDKKKDKGKVVNFNGRNTANKQDTRKSEDERFFSKEL